MIGADAYRAIYENDIDGDEVRRMLDALPTNELRRVERAATRLIWAAWDIRDQRKTS